jgi:glutamate racemase
MKIGVFDSGLGGLSVANAVRKALPEHEILFYNDHEHVPYGTKTKEELLSLSLPLLKQMQSVGCQVIVIACNTLTTNVIDQLRAKLQVPLVAVEPMVKPAVDLSESKVIAVCATPATLSSTRYQELKRLYASGVTVIQPNCSNWAELIEKRKMDQKQIKSMVSSVLSHGADVIVLGCTHYHWIEQDIKNLAADRAKVIQPEEAIIRELKLTLKQLA